MQVVENEMPSPQTIASSIRFARLRSPGHLRLLEAESIHILREVASEFERPVMLYSIGKDSSVMLRLAQKGVLSGTDSVSAPAYRYGIQV
jgi:sulfate adenylyltransferase subunit 2